MALQVAALQKLKRTIGLRGAIDRVLLSKFVVATHWLADGRPTRGAEKVELQLHLLPRIFRDCMHMAWETLAWLLTHVRRGP